MQTLDQNLYYLVVQEDGYVEWATFWAFLLAGAVYWYRALRLGFEFSNDWFLLSLAVFCLFVALEEISWGQRIVGYRPPEYFLESNFQQELNVHNVMDSDLRELALRLIIFGYGAALPAIMLVPKVGDALRGLGIMPPPARIMPAFLVTGVGQATYPFKFTGEWIELMLGLCFLFPALAIARTGAPQTRPAGRVLLAFAVIVAGGAASATATRLQRDHGQGYARAVQAELEALRTDFISGLVHSRCGVHKRLFSFAEKYGQTDLYSGEFARLAERGLPEQRAAYLLDPWNNAYWLRDICATGERERLTYVYSFGPNRRRDSTKWEIGGDDIAIFIRGGTEIE